MDVGYHPVMDQQSVMNSPMGTRSMDSTGQAMFDIPGLGDTNVTKFVAGLVLGALATLVLLRVAGFRFSFGVGVG